MSRSKRKKKRAHQEHEHIREQEERNQGEDQENTSESPDGHKSDQDGDQAQSSESVDEITSFIKRDMNNLMYMMKTQYGLLDELVSNNVLNTQQVSLIQEKDSCSGKTRQLLEEITRESMSDETKETLFNALDQTQQKHVSNWIRGKGERVDEYGDLWPLWYSTEWRSMTANRSNLVTLIDPRNGLLDAMLSTDCVNVQQKHTVERGTTDKNQNEILYEIVLWGSLATYNAFASCRPNIKLCPC